MSGERSDNCVWYGFVRGYRQRCGFHTPLRSVPGRRGDTDATEFGRQAQVPERGQTTASG